MLGYSTGDTRTVGATYADGLRNVADTGAAAFRAQLATTCNASDAAARTCADAFIRDFGRRAFRRPLRDREVTLLLEVYDKSRELGATMAVAERLRAGLDATLSRTVRNPL